MKTQTNPDITTTGGSFTTHPIFLTAVLIAIFLSLLFLKSFDSNYVHFSNDGPYGGMVQEFVRMPQSFTGVWANANWLGNEELSPAPSVTTAMRLVMSPLTYARFLPPAVLLIAGLCACFCFRKFELAPAACILGGLAAALNSDFFSTSCWGVSSQVVGFGANFVALGLVSSRATRFHWIRIILAGMAVGVGIMEAYDIGAIFSLFVAAYVIYRALFINDGKATAPVKLGKGILQVVLVAGFAAFISAHSLTTLIGTQLKGVVGMEQKVGQSDLMKEARWQAQTQWSLPKKEILQVMVPGLFGYRNEWHMYENDQPKEDQYWGSIGAGGGLNRLIGTGFYSGVAVVLIALWAALQSFRKTGSSFTPTQRRELWFWTGALIISALLAFGKNAPFYRFFYDLPYASTIRNPQKFMHVFCWALVIVFAYGVHGLWVGYMRNSVSRAHGFVAQLQKWLKTAAVFEKKFLIGCLMAIGLSILGWLAYFGSNAKLEAYLPTVGINPDLARSVAQYSVASVGWYVLFLGLSIGLLLLIFTGQFAGSRAKFGIVLLGLLLVIDLGTADSHWVVYWNVPYKYASDSVIRFLADKPYEHRVSSLPIQAVSQQDAMLHNSYGSHLKQQLFPYNQIQCAEIIQEPRVAMDKEQFMTALAPTNLFNIYRFWELSNTRYILGPGGDFLSHIDPAGKQLRLVKAFNFVPKTNNPSMWAVDYKMEEDPAGQLAVMEFLGALPRAKLFANWQVNTDDDATLKVLDSPDFNPHQTLLIANAAVGNPAATNAVQEPGSVNITSYHSKRIELTAEVKTPAILFLSERYNPKWRVEVDGHPAELLRCDFIMRGVYLTPGTHAVVFHYVSPLGTLYISLSCIALGVVLSCWLAFGPGKKTLKAEDKIGSV